MIEIGRTKRATKAYSLDDVAIVPTRRTRGTEEVDLTWRIDALTLDFPLVAAPMDSVMSPETVIAPDLAGFGLAGPDELAALAMRLNVPNPVLLAAFLVLCAGWYRLTRTPERAVAFFRRLRGASQLDPKGLL